VNDHLARPHPDTRDLGTASRLLVALVGLFFVLLPGTGTAVSSAPRDAAVREHLSGAARSVPPTAHATRFDKGAVPDAAAVAVHRDEIVGGDGPGLALVLADAGIPGSHRGPDWTVRGSDSAVVGVALGVPRGRAPPIFMS
jgi:hypothetical protein